MDWWNPVSSMGAFASILPMSPMINGRNWKESELGMDIQRYAPGFLLSSAQNFWAYLSSFMTASTISKPLAINRETLNVCSMLLSSFL